jgi:hypothetical protein
VVDTFRLYFLSSERSCQAQWARRIKNDQWLIPSVATWSVFPDTAVKSEFVGENDGESAKVLVPTSDRLLEPCPLLDRMADRGRV